MTQWSAFKSLHEMHNDPHMADYGVARYPLRDHEGELLGDRKVVGSYPWIDRDGDLIMWMAATGPLYYLDSEYVAHEQFEVVSHPHDCQADSSPSFCSKVILHPTTLEEIKLSSDAHGNRLGMSAVGLWTQGKMVSPDSRNNAADFGLANSKHQWRNVRLYADVPDGTLVAGGTVRFTIASPENQFFLHPNLQPDMPREVVWSVSTERQTDEVSFDDYLDPLALVVSPMNTSIRAEGNLGRFQNGFVHTSSYRGEGFQHAAHLANAATSVSEAVAQAAEQPGIDLEANVQWNIPAYGYLLGGARAEPIAAGGTKGRGLWLDGEDDRLEYLVPEQPSASQTDMASHDWFFNLAIDPRDPSYQQRLLSLPDGSWIDMVGPQELRLGRDTWTESINLPSALALTTKRWTSLGIASTSAQPFIAPRIEVYLDGYLLSVLHPPANAFRVMPGRVTVGDRSSGFRGWVDDFKIISLGASAGAQSAQTSPLVEVICNHARGTLVGLEPGDPLWTRAGAYPGSSHEAIMALVPGLQRFGRYACERPIDDPVDAEDLADHSNYLCLGQTRRLAAVAEPEKCLKHALLFPEGPLFFDLPRPSSVANPFCLSCHVNSHPSATMRATEALMPDMIPMHEDTRRQPMQNAPKIFGVVPADLFGIDIPPADIVTPVEGIPLDPFTTPSSDDL